MSADAVTDLRHAERWVITLRTPPAGTPRIPTMATPRGRVASLDDPRTWRDYATMRKALTVFRAYGPGFMLTLADEPAMIVPRLAALESECGPITLFMASPLPPEGLAARDERTEAAAARATHQEYVRRTLALGHAGGVWASPQALIDANRRRGTVPAETYDPEGVMAPQAGGERRSSGRIEHRLPD
jgi:hypothetical protein